MLFFSAGVVKYAWKKTSTELKVHTDLPLVVGLELINQSVDSWPLRGTINLRGIIISYDRYTSLLITVASLIVHGFKSGFLYSRSQR